MPRRIQAMIVEDNRQLAESIRSFFVMKNVMEVVEIASDSLDAIEKLKACGPDVIILDLVMPRSDGFVLLEYLNTLQGKSKPEVLVLSSLGHETIIKRACALGAVYYMLKPFSMEDLHERVVHIAGLRETSRTQSIQPFTGVKSIEQCLSTLLSDFGISRQHKGYQYISEAVNLVIAQPDLINNITKRLYPEVGKKLNCSPLAVERSIRRAIEVARISEAAQLDDHSIYDAPSPRHRLSNGEFISLISSKVLNALSN